jgi:RNA 3'-terminal phosphate cyclase (ATP)
MELALHSTGWYPRGGGEISARFGGAAGQGPKPSPLILTERGSLIRILAQVVTANLPEERQIAMRMFQAAREALPNMKAEVDVSIQEHRDGGTGAAILLVAEYRNWRAGFSALGRRGVPAERVGQEAAELLLAHNAGSGVLDTYLSDQILLPLSFAGGVSRFSVQQVSRHLETNAWVIEKFGVADIEIARRADCSGLVTITPAIFPRGT